jgi:integrase/recombinase XerD
MNEKIKVILDRLQHRGEHQISIRFEKDWKVIGVVKTLSGIRFSATHKCWYLHDTTVNHEAILRVLNDVAVIDDSALQSNDKKNTYSHVEAVRLMTEKLVLKGYSENTQRSYRDQFNSFLSYYISLDPGQLTEEHITAYMLQLIRVRKLSRSTQNQAINAIKFYYEQVLHQSAKVYHLERPFKERNLPVILNEDEITALFMSVKNIKHKIILMMLYSAGLRRSELLNLRVGDLDFGRSVVFIRAGKGRKDRQSVLSKTLKPLLDQYLERYKPNEWLFEGPDRKPYSATSLQAILKKAVQRAGISKHIKLHSLRHTFATHLLESGTSTRYIQVLLGHESSRTTEIYTHVTNFGVDRVKSPLDHIRLEHQKPEDGDC